MIRFSGIVFCHHSSLNSPGRLGGKFQKSPVGLGGANGLGTVGLGAVELVVT
jgi:hypothetical protein